MSNISKRQMPGGYSLIETLVGIWVFSMILLSLTGIFLYNYAVVSFSGNYVKASHLAQDLMYNLKINNYDNLEAKIGTSVYNVNTETNNYTISETIARRSDDEDSDDYDILTLKVQVNWVDSTKAETGDENTVMRMTEKIGSSLFQVGS
jgi:Tfp pilus assembly protein PilV